jgi:hypothetical protein
MVTEEIADDPRSGAFILLIVGARDEEVLRLGQVAYAQLRCEKSLAIVLQATHLFQEPGTLEEVARLAASWFRQHLRPRR